MGVLIKYEYAFLKTHNAVYIFKIHAFIIHNYKSTK